LLKRNK